MTRKVLSFGSEYDEEDLAQLRLSTQALDVLVLEKEIARDLFLAEQLGAKLFDKSATMKHKSDRDLKFEHLVRVYDALIASNYILADAAMEIIRGADADAVIEKLESDIDDDIEKYKKSREEALQGALTEPNDPIASKVKTLKVSSTGGMPRVVLEGKNIAEFVYNRGEPSVQFEQARAQHAKATGIPTPYHQFLHQERKRKRIKTNRTRKDSILRTKKSRITNRPNIPEVAIMRVAIMKTPVLDIYLPRLVRWVNYFLEDRCLSY